MGATADCARLPNYQARPGAWHAFQIAWFHGIIVHECTVSIPTTARFTTYNFVLPKAQLYSR